MNHHTAFLTNFRSAPDGRRLSRPALLAALFMLLLAVGPVFGQAADEPPPAEAGAPRVAPPGAILLDDFESYRRGALPTKWHAQLNGDLVPLTSQFFNDREWFEVRREQRNGFVRAYTNGETVHLSMANDTDFDWDTGTHPILAWDWRAVKLPNGAREDKDSLNDSGAGLYVILAVDGRFIKRPRIIKYVYSSTLPVGTVASYGRLKVVVVASGLDGAGRWQHIERDVAADHRELFGEPAPRRPLVIRLWADSDNTESVATSDFDNIMLLPRR